MKQIDKMRHLGGGQFELLMGWVDEEEDCFYLILVTFKDDAICSFMDEGCGNNTKQEIVTAFESGTLHLQKNGQFYNVNSQVDA